MILKASNLSLIKDQPVLHLTADAASASGTLTVDSIIGASIGKYALLGNFGEPTAEIVRIHTATAPTGTTITLNANTVRDHYVDCPLTIIDYNQVEFSRSTTATGDKSVLSTVDIYSNNLETYYNDLTNSTGYGFWRFKNSAGTTYSGYSDALLYTGQTDNTAEKIMSHARSLTGSNKDSDFATDEQLFNDINTAQDMIVYARNTNTGISQDWDFELVEDLTSITTTENENEYALSGLTYEIKYSDNKEAIMNLRLGNKILDYIDPSEMDTDFEGVAKTEVATQATAGQTSIVLDDVYEFAASGTFYVGGDTVTYTTRTVATNTLSGIPASGTGSITETHAVDSPVWQGISPDLPTKYTIFNGYIILNVPVDEDYAGQKLKLKYLRKLTRLSDVSDTVEIPFYHIIKYFVASQIEMRKRNTDLSNNFLNIFNDGLKSNIKRHGLPPMEEVEYYTYGLSDDINS